MANKNNNEKNTDNNPNKDDAPDISENLAVLKLRDEIIIEAKKLTEQKTSSAMGIITKTRDLLSLELQLKKES